MQAKNRHKKSNKSHHKLETVTSSHESSVVISPEFTYKIFSENICCFFKSPESQGRQHLHAEASAVLPTLFVVYQKIGSREKRSMDEINLTLRTINYQTVAVGQHSDVIVGIKNMSRHSFFLQYLTDIGSFQVLTPRKKIQSQEIREVFNSFCTNGKQNFLFHLRNYHT